MLCAGCEPCSRRRSRGHTVSWTWPSGPSAPAPRALAAQPAGGERVGGVQPIQPGHYVYLHTDDRPGASSTFNSGVIVTSDGVVVVDALGSDAIARRARDAIRILHLGRAHTRGDSIVFVPEDRIAYLGEVFNFEELPYTRDSYLGEWLRTLEVAEALEADIFVPGHGFLPDDPRETRDGLRRHRQLLLDVRDAVQRQIQRRGDGGAGRHDGRPARYRRFQGYSRAMEMAVRRWYRELTVGLD